jgi:hypothetical protein
MPVMPTVGALGAGTTPFDMPVMPVMGAVSQTVAVTAPVETPSTMVMNAAPGVAPVMNAMPQVTAMQPTAEQMAQIVAQQQAEMNPVFAPAPGVAARPTLEELNAQINIAPVQGAPLEMRPISIAPQNVSADDMAALGIESTVVTSTVLPVVEPTPIQAAPVQVAQQAEEPGMISKMSAAQYDNFIKILEAINSDTNALVNNISNGSIALLREGGLLTTKIDHIFGTKSWVFNNPAVQIKRLKFAKGEGETIIVNDSVNDILISKNNKGETANIVKLSQIEEDFLPPSLAKDYGERKYSCQLDKDQVRRLCDAKTSYEKSTFHITIDKNTNEIVKIHIGDDDFVTSLLVESGRDLQTYVVTQLFPIIEEAYISIYINDRNEVSFKSSVDIYNATISFHIGADEYVKSLVANLKI